MHIKDPESYLQPALDEIERGNHGVGDATREETPEAAIGIVSTAAKLTGIGFCTSSSREGSAGRTLGSGEQV